MIKLSENFVLQRIPESHYVKLMEHIKPGVNVQANNLIYLHVFKKEDILYRGLPIKLIKKDLLLKVLLKKPVVNVYKKGIVLRLWDYVNEKFITEEEDNIPYWTVWYSLASAISLLPSTAKYFAICKQLE